MFEGDFGDGFRSGFTAETRTGISDDRLSLDAFIARQKAVGIAFLREQLSVVCNTIESQCTKLFDSKFELLKSQEVNRAHQRKIEDLRRRLLKNKWLRDFLDEYWNRCLVGIAVLIVGYGVWIYNNQQRERQRERQRQPWNPYLQEAVIRITLKDLTELVDDENWTEPITTDPPETLLSPLERNGRVQPRRLINVCNQQAHMFDANWALTCGEERRVVDCPLCRGKRGSGPNSDKVWVVVSDDEEHLL